MVFPPILRNARLVLSLEAPGGTRQAMSIRFSGWVSKDGPSSTTLCVGSPDPPGVSGLPGGGGGGGGAPQRRHCAALASLLVSGRASPSAATAVNTRMVDLSILRLLPGPNSALLGLTERLRPPPRARGWASRREPPLTAAAGIRSPRHKPA